ncbi:MAG: exodeoxyribonuclease III [Candidatus Omnitrophica bacterium]|nr:exodeoxyribonuclease III [Candidatus Omnitrophota bacterium]
MKLLSWNVNGIRAISDKGFLNWVKKEKPDILCLQETKASPEQLDPGLRTPAGYFSYWNSPAKKGYAGVAVYTKVKPALVNFDFPPRSFNTEARALILDFKKFILMNVYFPNGGASAERLRYKLEFYDGFLKFLDDCEDKNMIICGDFNTAHKEIDLARPKENEMSSGFLPEERAWMDKFIAHGFVDTFRHFNKGPKRYTWWDYKTRSRERNVGWRIDYFFVSAGFIKKVKKAFIMPEVEGSDHCPVGIELEIE